MSLLAAYDAHLAYHGKPILRGESIAIERKDRVGIVGRNGTGKSSLLRLLTGQVEPDVGKVVRARDLRVGFLAQELAEGGDVGLLDSVIAAAPRRTDLERRVSAIESELDEVDDEEEKTRLALELADLHVELGDLERHFAPHHARRILLGLGFSSDDFDRRVREFSGGWRMRAALAGLLFGQPEVLLLDEPTNHLDLPSVHWLNRFLDGFPHALVLVCHDKEFLNRHVQRIISLETEGIRTYTGNYDDYLELREQELIHLEAQARKVEQKQKQLQQFVDRFRAKASKARQAQSKARLIEKLEQEQAVELPDVRRSIVLKFPPTVRSGDPVIEIEGLGHAYGENRVLKDVDLNARRGDRIAIVGLNGAGKTTLLKLIAGELPVESGTIRFGANVARSYFAQHHAEVLDRERSVLEEVWSAAPSKTQSEARGLCGAFLFSGDDVEKRIGVLSGGEKTRVALARLLIAPGNLLLLDEPTNHLDTESSEKLAKSLSTYDGTILFVSHDLAFARGLSTKVWDVANGTVREYQGSLGDYLDRVAADQARAELGLSGEERSAARRASNEPRTDGKQARIEARDALAKRRKERAKLAKKTDQLFDEIAALEASKVALEAELSNPAIYDDAARASDVTTRHRGTVHAIAAKTAEWEDLSSQLEALPEP